MQWLKLLPPYDLKTMTMPSCKAKGHSHGVEIEKIMPGIKSSQYLFYTESNKVGLFI